MDFPTTGSAYPSEGHYIRVKSYSTHVHSLVVFFHTSGDNAHDSVEVLQTADKLYTKCVRINNYPLKSTPPTSSNLQHFVSITDLNSADNNTTGMRKNEALNSVGTSFTTSVPTTSTVYLDPNPNNDPNGPSSFLHGFFNNSQFMLAAVPGFGFVNPTDAKLLAMYDQGINTELLGAANLDFASGTGGSTLWLTNRPSAHTQ